MDDIKLPMLEDKLTKLTEKYVMVDIKYRDGKWWARGVTELRPRNDTNNPTLKREVTCEAFEDIVDGLLA